MESNSKKRKATKDAGEKWKCVNRKGSAQLPVIIADNDTELGPQVAKELGPLARYVEYDVTVEAQVAEAVNVVMAHYGKLDIMYNNAGIPGPSVPPGIVDLDLNEFDFVMKINKRGMIADIKHAARVMILVGLGSILCTSSISGDPCISPAPIPTPMVLAQIGKFYPGLTQEQIVGIVNEFGELEGAKCEDIDVAKAPLYLASDEAKFISGLNLIVDGGFTSFKSLTCHLQIKMFNPSY
ncbi:hypothetical protein GYH30_052614 [Glycine max]|nr:hypothetical protein GYH30_052614 [Glycine max]